MTKPTKEQFEEYVYICSKGFSNLFDGRYICEVSETGLTTEMCVFIKKHFGELEKEFGVEA